MAIRKKRSKVDAATSRLEDAFDRSKGLFLEEAELILRSTLCGQSPNAVSHIRSSSVQPGKGELMSVSSCFRIRGVCVFLAHKIVSTPANIIFILQRVRLRAQLPIRAKMKKMQVRRRQIMI